MIPRRPVHAVIYIPGLGDNRIKGQRKAVGAWRVQGVEPYLFQMNWADSEAFTPKLERLLALIDRLAAEGKTVSLVAASAGASTAMHAYAARENTVNGVVSICGKLSGLHSVHPLTYRRNPAFLQSMRGLNESVKSLDMAARARILSLRALADEAVPLADTRLPGTVGKTMPVAGHFFGIAYGLTVGSFTAIRFLKRMESTPRPDRIMPSPAVTI